MKGRNRADARDGISSQAELEKSQANVPNVAIASFTLNKALQHVVPPTLQQNDVARFLPKLTRGGMLTSPGTNARVNDAHTSHLQSNSSSVGEASQVRMTRGSQPQGQGRCPVMRECTVPKLEILKAEHQSQVRHVKKASDKMDATKALNRGAVIPPPLCRALLGIMPDNGGEGTLASGPPYSCWTPAGISFDKLS